MKTDELIQVLSTRVEPADLTQVIRGFSISLALGVTATLSLALLALGTRPDVWSASALPFLLAKLGFAAGVVAFAARYLLRLAHPGGERNVTLPVVLAPFAASVLLGAISLASVPSSHWQPMVVGHNWLECVLFIPLMALVPFALTILAVRSVAAPTDLVRTGALVGLLAGGVSAMGYALHCTDDSLPFVALWYGVTVALCTLAGALLGPRLLRW